MLNAGEKRQVVVPLNELLKDASRYEATLYYQPSDKKKEEIKVKTIRFSKGQEQLVLDVVANSGCVLHLTLDRK